MDGEKTEGTGLLNNSINQCLNANVSLFADCSTYLFDCLALGDLRVANHLVWRADLNEGELRVLCNLGCQGRLSTVGWTWECVWRGEEGYNLLSACVWLQQLSEVKAGDFL